MTIISTANPKIKLKLILSFELYHFLLFYFIFEEERIGQDLSLVINHYGSGTVLSLQFHTT